MKKSNPGQTTGRFLAALSGSLLAAVFLCGSTLKAEVTARGSDATLHVLKALAAAYQADTGKTVTLQGGGSGAGAKALASGEVTLAFLLRELTSAEKAAGLAGTEYARDGVTIIVHPANPAVNLSLAELKDLFTGKTTAWPDGKPVVLFNRNTDAGIRQVFQDKVLGAEGFSPTAAVKHDGVLVSSVSKIPTATAYTSFSEADEARIKIVAVNGIKPSAATLKDKTYPLTTTAVLATKGAATGEEKAFIDYVLSAKGQAVVAKEGLVPIQ
jgi:phosphate transport system substrate-binding protein